MDEMRTDAQALAVFTVGHSNVALADFIALLQRHTIGVLVDVRSAPYSKYVPHFNGPVLKEAVVAAGMRYLYLGSELGGRPRDRQFYDAAGHARYDLLARSPLFLAGIERLIGELGENRVAIMCGEENPAECHRRLLVGRVFAERGVDVRHIRGDGRVQTEAELGAGEKRAGRNSEQQGFAFAAAERDAQAAALAAPKARGLTSVASWNKINRET